jgi:hypothetical protein
MATSAFFPADIRPFLERQSIKTAPTNRSRSTRHDDGTCDLRPSFSARHQGQAVQTHDCDGREWQRESSLYRALKLLADIAQGRIVQSLASEGGLQSALWAGPEAFFRAR